MPLSFQYVLFELKKKYFSIICKNGVLSENGVLADNKILKNVSFYSQLSCEKYFYITKFHETHTRDQQ